MDHRRSQLGLGDLEFLVGNPEYVLIKVQGDDLKSVDHCLVFHVAERSTMIIEDDELAKDVMRAMRDS